jgi:branched-chain amino acid transport system substrate-binding protein
MSPFPSAQRAARGRAVMAMLAISGLAVTACSSDSSSTATSAAVATSAGATQAPADTKPADTKPADTTPAQSAAPADTTPADTAAPDTTAGATGLDCVGPQATGDSVVLGIVWPEGPAISLPELGASANAAVSYLNECKGGIAGRPIKLDKCTIDETNPGSATDCGNKFVTDKVDAVVVTITSSGATLVPIITAAGIPYVVSGGTSPAESLDSTGLVFSLSGGVGALLGAIAQRAVDEKLSKVAFLVSDNAAAGVQGLLGIPFGKAGVDFQVIPVPAGTPDMSSQVSAAVSSGAQATAVVGDAPFCISALQAMQSLDPTGAHWVITTCIGDDVVSQLGKDALENAVAFGATDIAGDDPYYVLYRAVMEKYSPGTPVDGFTGAGYGTIMSMVSGLAGLTGDVSAAAIASTLAATKDVPAGGYGLTYGCADKPLPPLTVCGGATTVGVMKDGKATDIQLIDASPLFKS